MKRLFALMFIIICLFSFSPVMAEEVAPVVTDSTTSMLETIQALLPWATFGIVMLMLFQRGDFKGADTEAVKQIDIVQNDPAQMRLLEMQYANADKMVRAAVDTIQVMTTAFAPLTKFAFDDAASVFLKDVQQVGPLTDAAVPPFTDDVEDKQVVASAYVPPPTYNGSNPTATTDTVVQG